MKILAKSFPMRCDICHKADCFEAENNYCARCININVTEDSIKQDKSSNKQSVYQICKEILMFCLITGTINGGLIVVFDLIHSKIPNSFEPFTINIIIKHAIFSSPFGSLWGLISLLIIIPILKISGSKYIRIKGVIIGTLLGLVAGMLLKAKMIFCGNSTEAEVMLTRIFWLISPMITGMVTGYIAGKLIRQAKL